MSNSLEERLKTHSSAFDGLLSLIPAKYYYDEATSDQWQQKKKSKKELQQNKRAKLDPESKTTADEYANSHVTAKDVMDNKALTAKRVVLPGSKPKPQLEQAQSEEDESNNEDNKADDVDADDDSDEVEIPDMDVDVSEEESDDEKVERGSEDSFLNTSAQLIFDDEGNEVAGSHGSTEAGNFEKKNAQEQKKKKELSPEEQRKKEENLAKLREKLSAKINGLKEKRKAPGTKVAGAPQSREQILAERKRREEIKRQEKLKRKSEQMEESDSSEGESDDEDNQNEEDEGKSVLFGNIVFNDGSRVTSDLTKLRSTQEKRKQKGPANNDLKAHLLKIEQKKRKLASLAPEDQEKQKEKDKWQRVMAQAEGVKVKDDEKLLKKALKRKEKQKLKSEIEWRERKQVVKDTVSARAKRREENLKARKDNKGKKSKNQPKLRKFTGIVNKAAKKRAGFEGSAKSKNKSKK
ncbi:surfeit locus protein 6-domain-containing protein [Scheffersomyces xylosifermentans]|uniref:surfeit locus protein 6-domain-containing protein n=1 Tax=Scheffersomyces xylosifermentans TaxID=1304137 RepID=UPI00315C636A